MPIALEPNQQFPIVLSSDADKQLESRPTFYTRALTIREQRKLSAELDAAIKHATANEIFDHTCRTLREYIVGWSNMGNHKYGESDFEDIVSHSEARELLHRVLATQYATIEEKKS